MTRSNTVSRIAAFAFVGLLGACGGGGGGGGPSLAEGGISGSGSTPSNGTSSGPIDGFGSVIVNGTAFDTNAATITLDGISGTESDLATGQVVSVVGDLAAESAESISYRSEIKGPITDVTIIDIMLGQAVLTVLGQTVEVIASTNFDDTTLGLLSVGDLVEVSGLRDNDGILVATFIEGKQSLAEYKVVGTATNASATTFELDTLVVDYTSASTSNLIGGAVNDGDRVEVKADPADFTAPDQLVASEVERLSGLAGEEDDDFELEGFITDFVDPTDFKVLGVPVRTSANTTFINGTSASLANNVKVQVEGRIASDDVLETATVEIQSTGTLRAEGTLEAVDVNASTVTLLGMTFESRPETEIEDESSAALDPLTLGDLSVGEYVEVRGFLDGQTPVAAELERDDPDPDARLRGPVLAEDEAAGTVGILGVTVRGEPPITDYEDENDNPITQAQFHATVELGTFVDAQWDNFVDTTVTADELSLEDDD